MDGRRIEKNGKRAGKDSRPAERREGESFLALGKVRKQKESHRETREGERRPGEQRKEPWLRLIEDVHAVDVGLDGPRQELRPMRRPKRWRCHGHGRRRKNSRHQSAHSRRRGVAI